MATHCLALRVGTLRVQYMYMHMYMYLEDIFKHNKPILLNHDLSKKLNTEKTDLKIDI